MVKVVMVFVSDNDDDERSIVNGGSNVNCAGWL